MKAETENVRVEKKVKAKVLRHIKNSRQTIGGFFSLAALEKIQNDIRKAHNQIPETAWLGTGELKNKNSGV